MALGSGSIGKKVGVGFALSAFIVLVLLVVSYLMLGRIIGASGVSEDVAALAESGQTTMLLLGITGFAIVCVVGFFVGGSSFTKLGDTVARLVQSVNSLGGAAGQVTSSSQSLADGTTGQAANLQETSSAVEELSSLTRSNADNTKEANSIMISARSAFSEADASIQKLTTSMGDITAASEQTQKIVKTIDEIAFQTNLLALNAAVEAARAGEAGAGFAVVADEVRNLAMRAAEAAKDTSVMIDTTVSKVQGGTALVTETNELFYMASKASEKVGVLVTEIATASEEQATGIVQIGNTINDMDRLTQGLAATSEESASVSLTLRSQVGDIEQLVKELEGVTGQDVAGRSPRVASSPRAAAVQRGGRAAVLPVKSKKTAQVQQLPSSPTPSGAGKKAEDVIPFGDDDFEDF